MPESKPVLVFQALMDVGRGLTGSRPWGGAYPQELTVFEGTPAADRVVPVPALGFEELGGTTEVHGTKGGQTAFKYVMEVRVTGYVESTEDVGAPTWRLRLYDDLETALQANDKLAGLVANVTVGARRTANRTAAPRSEFDCDLTLEFYEQKPTEVTP